MPKKKLDPESEAAMETAAMDEKGKTARQLLYEQRQQALARAHEMVGQIKTAAMYGKFSDVSTLVWLAQVKDSKLYKDVGGGTWEAFCNILGVSRVTADANILNLSVLGEDFLRTVNGLNVGYRDLRKLRLLTAEGAVEVGDTAIVIGEERIPLDADHRDDLAAALEKLMEGKDKSIKEMQATIRAKDKVLGAKENVIQRQEKDIQKLEGSSKMAAPKNDAEFLEKVAAWKTGFDAWLFQFEPSQNNPLPDNPTPCMRAAWVEALGYFARRAIAVYQEAQDIFGNPYLDGVGDPADFGPGATMPEDLQEAGSDPKTWPELFPKGGERESQS